MRNYLAPFSYLLYSIVWPNERLFSFSRVPSYYRLALLFVPVPTVSRSCSWYRRAEPRTIFFFSRSSSKLEYAVRGSTEFGPYHSCCCRGSFVPLETTTADRAPSRASRITTMVGKESHPSDPMHKPGTEPPPRPTATDRVGEPPVHPSGSCFFVASPSVVVFSLLLFIPGRCRGRG